MEGALVPSQLDDSGGDMSPPSRLEYLTLKMRVERIEKILGIGVDPLAEMLSMEIRDGADANPYQLDLPI